MATASLRAAFDARWSCLECIQSPWYTSLPAAARTPVLETQYMQLRRIAVGGAGGAADWPALSVQMQRNRKRQESISSPLAVVVLLGSVELLAEILKCRDYTHCVGDAAMPVLPFLSLPFAYSCASRGSAPLTIQCPCLSMTRAHPTLFELLLVPGLGLDTAISIPPSLAGVRVPVAMVPTLDRRLAMTTQLLTPTKSLQEYRWADGKHWDSDDAHSLAVYSDHHDDDDDDEEAHRLNTGLCRPVESLNGAATVRHQLRLSTLDRAPDVGSIQPRGPRLRL